MGEKKEEEEESRKKGCELKGVSGRRRRKSFEQLDRGKVGG